MQPQPIDQLPDWGPSPLHPVIDILSELVAAGDLATLLTLPPRPHAPPSALTLPPSGLPCQCDTSGLFLLPKSQASGFIVSATYGDRVLVICPGCAAGQERGRIWRNLPAEGQDIHLDTLDGYDHQEEAMQAIGQLLQVRCGWLTLCGDYGRGKTTLIYATLNALGDLGVFGRYETAPDLLTYLRDGMSDTRGASPSARLQGLIDAPLLAIDELDKYQPTEFAEQAIFRLFDARYRARNQQITLLGYNQAREDRIPPFLLSRMHDGRFAHITLLGTDLRPQLGGDVWDRGVEDYTT